MRSTTTFLLYSAFLLLISTFAAAWPWPNFLPEIDSIIVRRDDEKPDPSPTSDGITVQKQTHTSDGSTAPTQHTSDSKHSSSNIVTSGAKSTGSKTTSYSKPKHTSYDPRLPPGGVTMLSPATTSGLPIFKIGEEVTFGYNFTSLSATPTALNIMATCSANQAMYTIAMNQTVDTGAKTEQALWDTNGYETSSAPLVMATYTLIMYDSDGSPSDVPEAGYLAPFTTFAFGMYPRQQYENDNGPIKCISCSGALSSLERSALGFVFGMGVITVLTFTWFVNGLNVIW